MIFSTIEPPKTSDMNFFEIEDAKFGKLYVHKRPHLDQFLQTVASFAEINVFTASIKEYADPIIDNIDRQKKVVNRYYRDDCKKGQGDQIVKDMSVVAGFDKKRSIVVDDCDKVASMYR